MNEKQIDEKARQILQNMSLKEKIGQVVQLYYDGENFEEVKDTIRNIHPGSLILCGSALGGNEQQAEVKTDRIDELQNIALHDTPSGIPILFGRDVIHGHHVAFPVPLTMAASFDPALIRECYDAVRQEAVSTGIKWTFAPMVDMGHDPRWGRIVEGPGEDPYLCSCIAEAVVKGFQTEDPSAPEAMVTCAKHFVGYGACEGGRDYNHTEIGDYAMQNMYLPSFRSAVNAGAMTVMASFNDVNGIPMHGNRKMLTDVLRGQMGFDGFVVSDWDGVRQMTAFNAYAVDKKQAAERAINAGVDMDMATCSYLENMEELVKEGTVSIETLDTAVLRILKVKLRCGLFDHPLAQRTSYDRDKHMKLSEKMARESLVLLKNKNSILPLSRDAKIGLAGPFLDEKNELVGTWSLDPKFEWVKSIREALQEVSPKTEFIVNSGNYGSEVGLLYYADCLVLFLGESRRVTGEANSLCDIHIPEPQRAILHMAHRTGKPVIGVLCFARPIVLGTDEELFDAILYAGHGGTCAANAIASVLFGDEEPGGRLPFTLPYAMGQIPLYYNALPGSRQINEYYGDVNRYHKNYRDGRGAPNFSFGQGMTYTEFTWSQPQVDYATLPLEEVENGAAFRVSVTVTNTGKRAGTAVTQLYVRDLFGTRIRPLRVLRGFERTLLQPDESRTLTFTVGYEDLGFYLEDGSFIAEKGDFRLFVGESSITTNEVAVALN